MAARYDITISKGKTFKLGLGWTADDVPVDLTGCTVVFKIRPKDAAESLTYTVGSGNIVWVDQDSGEFQLLIPHTTTDDYTWTSGVYEVNITLSNGEVIGFLEGAVKVKPEI